MNQDLIYSACGLLLFVMGFFAVITCAHVLRKLIGLNIMGMGVFMILLATAKHESIIDPIPHAMVLTGIVVAVAGSAMCVWLALSFHKLKQIEVEDRQ